MLPDPVDETKELEVIMFGAAAGEVDTTGALVGECQTRE